MRAREVTILAGQAGLEATLELPPGSRGIVVFAHGSGSGRSSPRNRFVAQRLGEAGLGSLLVDLLTAAEAVEDARTRVPRFDVERLGERVAAAIDWLAAEPATRELAVGAYGASTGAAAALAAAARRPERVVAVVSRGGRPDLAGEALPTVRAPTLLVVGGEDRAVLDLNRRAMAAMRAEVALEVVPGAGHLFEEPGGLEAVADLTVGWMARHLIAGSGGGVADERGRTDHEESR